MAEDVEEALRYAADVLRDDRVIPLAEQQARGWGTRGG